jgi:hypothetical protein
MSAIGKLTSGLPVIRAKSELICAEREVPIYELAGLATCLVYRLLVPKRPVQIETVPSTRSLRSIPTLRGRNRAARVKAEAEAVRQRMEIEETHKNMDEAKRDELTTLVKERAKRKDLFIGPGDLEAAVVRMYKRSGQGN